MLLLLILQSIREVSYIKNEQEEGGEEDGRWCQELETKKVEEVFIKHRTFLYIYK